MIKNYLKLFLRLLARNPFFTFINVFGLSLGFAVFMILWQHADQGLKAEHFIKDHESVVRICTLCSWTDNRSSWQESLLGSSSVDVPVRLKKDYREVDDYTRMIIQSDFRSYLIKSHGDKVYITHTNEKDQKRSFIESKMVYGDPNLFNFFSLHFIAGNIQEALKFPDAIVISESQSKKYFGSGNALGKTLMLNDSLPLKVTGVFDDLPGNTHLEFNMVMSMERIANGLKNHSMADGAFIHCYLKLQKGTDAKGLSTKINNQLKNYVLNETWGNRPSHKAVLGFQALDQAPFESYRGDNYITRSKYLLFVLRYSSLIILLMAWINYVNLTLSANNKRIKELAVRKTSGAGYVDFIIQFLTEALVINIISLLGAICLIELLTVPAGKLLQFHFQNWNAVPQSLVLIFSVIFVSGILITGIYPALITLKRSPKNLFGIFKAGKGNNVINNVLTTFEFTIATILLTWMFIGFLQMRHVLNGNMGFNKENTLVIDFPLVQKAEHKERINFFSEQIARIPNFRRFCTARSIPGDGDTRQIPLTRSMGDLEIKLSSNGGCDENFIPFFNIQLLAGRNFLHKSPGDSNSVIISKAGIRRLGFSRPEDAIGQTLQTVLGRQNVTIIGVIEDYKLQPFLTQGVDLSYGGNPGIALTYKDYISPDFNAARMIAFRIASPNIDETIKKIEKIYSSTFPDQPFHWYFLDQLINSRYNSYQIALNQMIFFTAIAIIIACLGLLGIIANKAVEKTKEIGIRKVLGAQIHHILIVLLNSTGKQILIATMIGLPIAWYLTRKYFENFSEHVHVQWWHFGMAIFGLVFIMLATIFFRLVSVIKANPVEALKHE